MSKLPVAVVGLGRAGRARARALEQHPQARLAGQVGRSGEPTFSDVIADRSIDALIIATPNFLHAEMVQAALEAGKHVAVEFPLAESASRGRELLALAHSVDRVLHVEHIELLSSGQRQQRERVRDLGALRGGELVFSGGSEGWIGDPDRAGSPALRAVARLHRVFDLFGSAQVSLARQRTEPDGYRLQVELAFEASGTIRLIEQRGRGLRRSLRWRLDCENGRLGDPDAPPSRGLFSEDLDCFLARVSSGAPSYVSDERILEVLTAVGEIEARIGRPS